MRRLDVEEVLGYVPAPDIQEGAYLVDILFQVGPTKVEGPISELDLVPWERRRGVELQPWQAEAVVAMSRAYMAETHTAREIAAPPPWPPAVSVWRRVTSKRSEEAAATARKTAEAMANRTEGNKRNGNRK